MELAEAITFILSGTYVRTNLEGDQQYLLKDFIRSGNLQELELLARYILNIGQINSFFMELDGVLPRNQQTDFEQKLHRKFIRVFTRSSWLYVLQEYSRRIGYSLKGPFNDGRQFINQVRNILTHKWEDERYTDTYENNEDEMKSGSQLYKSMRNVAPLVFIKIFEYVRESRNVDPDRALAPFFELLENK